MNSEQINKTIKTLPGLQFNFQVQTSFIQRVFLDHNNNNQIPYNSSLIEASMNTSKTITQSTQKFHLKTSMNNSVVDASLDQAIKKSNVKSFIKKGVGAPNQSGLIEQDQNLGLEEHLLQLKKSCSDLTRQIKIKEQQTTKFKDETSFTYQKSKKIKDERLTLQQKIAELQKNLDKVSSKRQAAFHGSKTYQHILQRMKKDDIHHQLSKNQLERELKVLEKQFSLIQAKHYSMSQLQKLSIIGLKDAHQQLQEQKNGRKQNFHSIEQQTQRKLDQQNKLKNRQKQTQQIQQLAADDIQDADLMRLKKFMTVQIFLRELLKSKISKLKRYYEPYEQAFFQIKSNTNVRDANSLKGQFFNFQNAYNQKTVWVKHLQTEIAEAEEQKKKLQEKLSESRIAEMQMIQKMQDKQKVSCSINKKQLNEKSIQHQLVWQRIKSWMGIQCKKMKINIDSQYNSQKLFKQIVQEFKPNQQLQEKKQEQKPQKLEQLKQQKKVPQQEKLIQTPVQ